MLTEFSCATILLYYDLPTVYNFKRPRLKATLIAWLNHHPRLKAKLRHLTSHGLGRSPGQVTPVVQTVPRLVVAEPGVIASSLIPDKRVATS